MNEKYIPLYRKYRPQKLEEVVGQEHIKKALRNAIELDKISHAYLIETNDCPYGFDIAMSLSKSFLCQKKNNSPCSSCNICLNIDTNNYPDLKIIEADSKIIKKEQ